MSLSPTPSQVQLYFNKSNREFENGGEWEQERDFSFHTSTTDYRVQIQGVHSKLSAECACVGDKRAHTDSDGDVDVINSYRASTGANKKEQNITTRVLGRKRMSCQPANNKNTKSSRNSSSYQAFFYHCLFSSFHIL